MIRFTADLIPSESPLSNIEAHVSNEANLALANRLSSLFGNLECENHPLSISEILVHFQDKPKVMSVVSCCCDDFRKTLEKIAQNEEP